MFDIYLYGLDDGELFAIEHSIEDGYWKSFAQELHQEGWAIKVVDQSDGAVVYTLG
jgi:hypothetical protein